MSEQADLAFETLTNQLLLDPDDDVTVNSAGLHVHGRLFAFRDGDALFVDLPAERAADLISRGIASRASGDEGAPRGAWVRIADPEDWPELASESHQFVGEPAVGKQS
ncbi:hypothetical protein [Leifsonia sp. NPDC058248]|uniref:hypothetical protein n=1 Tax=Leifsonia sp. NPDC058248 TaxID=3346402 RepID=UPI0036DF6360